nr:hypothetical protein [Tanacetum cinerariifolium]GEV56630.1 hypothetical protein [Tanacetum cinerariifolium]
MHSRFEMSLMGKMKFFLGFQIHQSPRGIFINQAKYALEILKKYGIENSDSIGTPMANKPKLDANLSGTLVDQTKYRSMIGSLMYLTFSRPDIVQADFGFELTDFSDADHAGCLDTHKSTSGGIQFLADNTVSFIVNYYPSLSPKYLQHEHYALWEGIEFDDSYKAPPEETAKDKGLVGEVSVSTKKKRRTVAITTEDMQKRKNDVKARTTLLLALPDEHQLRFSKYNSAKELWEAILKTFWWK